MPAANYSSSAVSLRGLFPKARFIGGHDIRVTSCSHDAGACEPGDLFVAVTRDEGDGHEEVAEAVRRGASAVLAERLLPIGVPTCVVPDTRHAHGSLCQALAGNPSDQLQLVGVTGSNGKTVTSELIASILQASRRSTGLINGLGADDGERTLPTDETTPHAPELADWLRRMVANRCSHAVLEVSSAGLAQHRTAGLSLDAIVLTNVRRDHADEHGSVWNYRSVKARLFEQLKPGGFAVINADDPASQWFLDHLDQPVLTIGMRNDAEITATVLERHATEQTFLLHAGSDSIPVRTTMIGDHHVYNCLAAAAVGLVWGLDLITIARGLESIGTLPGRLEPIQCGQPFAVYSDCARTPDALAASLRAIRRVTRGRVICVYGAEGERRQGVRANLGRVVERGANLEVITSDNPRGEAPLAIVHDILDGYDRPARPLVRPDRQQAILWALEQAREGDSVLIAGPGGAGCQEIGSRVIPWDDRDIVRHWLYEHPEAGVAPRPGHAKFKIVG